MELEYINAKYNTKEADEYTRFGWTAEEKILSDSVVDFPSYYDSFLWKGWLTLNYL